MPIASAPSMSSSIMSPTIAASVRLDLEQVEHGPEDRRVRLRLAVMNELIPASMSSAWCRANSCMSRAEFETRPIFSPQRRSS